MATASVAPMWASHYVATRNVASRNKGKSIRARKSLQSVCVARRPPQLLHSDLGGEGAAYIKVCQCIQNGRLQKVRDMRKRERHWARESAKRESSSLHSGCQATQSSLGWGLLGAQGGCRSCLLSGHDGNINAGNRLQWTPDASYFVGSTDLVRFDWVPLAAMPISDNWTLYQTHFNHLTMLSNTTWQLLPGWPDGRVAATISARDRHTSRCSAH